MTSRASANTDHLLGRRGFTLVEILVVISIIVILAALLLPSVNKARRQALRTAMASDLQAIATALDAYRQDFGDYPRVKTDTTIPTPSPDPLRPNPMTGAQILCFALMGPAQDFEPPTPPPLVRLNQDGADGTGFRARGVRGDGPDANTTPGDPDDMMQGKVTPAYLSPDRFKMADPSDPSGNYSTATGRELLFCLIDRFNQPILYFPASPTKPNVTLVGTPAPYVDSSLVPPNPPSEKSRYDGDDNLVWFTDDPRAATPTGYPEALRRLRALLGDRHGAAAGSPMDGVIQPDETPADLPYVLWSAGPDEKFGPILPATSPLVATGTPDSRDLTILNKCDDVSNFQR